MATFFFPSAPFQQVICGSKYQEFYVSLIFIYKLYIFIIFPTESHRFGRRISNFLQLQLGMLHTKPLGPASQNKLPLKRSCWPYIWAYLQMGIPVK